MSLTVADLPVILADLARVEPERFDASASATDSNLVCDVKIGRHWHPVEVAMFPYHLALVQAAVQEAIVARGWSYKQQGWDSTAYATVGIPADPDEQEVEREADLPAVALASAYRDALLAQQEGSSL